jgi:hypothetical protein
VSIVEFNPDFWLTSLQRSLTSYTLDEIDKAVMVGANPSGLDTYEVIYDWPDAAEMAKDAKLEKTLIHFAIDDINNIVLGLGENIYNTVENTVPDPDLLTRHEGQCHEVNFDVGVWASDQSGGVTSRLVVYEMLHKVFGTEIGKRKLRSTIDVEVLRFNGGRFITDRINDLRVFRIIDCELVARVYSRHITEPQVIVDDFEIDEIFTVGGDPIT